MLVWSDYSSLDDVTIVSSPDFTERERALILSALFALESRAFWDSAVDDTAWDIMQDALAEIAGKISP